MTADQATAMLVALTGLLGALAVLWREVRAYHQQVNSRMDQLLELTKQSSHAEGLAEQQKAPPES